MRPKFILIDRLCLSLSAEMGDFGEAIFKQQSQKGTKLLVCPSKHEGKSYVYHKKEFLRKYGITRYVCQNCVSLRGKEGNNKIGPMTVKEDRLLKDANTGHSDACQPKSNEVCILFYLLS